MSKFKQSDFKINEEDQASTEIKIVKIDTANVPTIKAFEIKPIKPSENSDYISVKGKYGPLAVTDEERDLRGQKDRRFSLNPLLRDPLSVEQEERRVIEEKVRARVETLAAAAKLAASELGYQEGLKKGFEEASKKLQAAGAVSLEKFDQLVKEAENAKDDIFRANERFLIELIFRIARIILLKEISADRDYIVRLAKELIARVGVRDNVTLRISAEDADVIGIMKDGFKKAYGDLVNINIETSSQVSRGGCKIETEWNAIDASIETQLQGIYQALVGKNGGGST